MKEVGKKYSFGECIDFASVSHALSARDKINLILFSSGAKKSSFISLKLNNQTAHEERHFDSMLEKNDILFTKNQRAGYEEITRIKNNRIQWQKMGDWIGYDLYADRGSKIEFQSYVDALLKRQMRAGKIAGALYNYPTCCVLAYGRKKIEDSSAEFPFVFHTPHNSTCKKTQRLNESNERIIKKNLYSLWTRYTHTETYRVNTIVVNDSAPHVVSAKQLGGKFWMIPCKELHEHGTLLDSEICVRYERARVSIKGMRKKMMNGIYHYRALPPMTRSF